MQLNSYLQRLWRNRLFNIKIHNFFGLLEPIWFKIIIFEPILNQFFFVIIVFYTFCIVWLQPVSYPRNHLFMPHSYTRNPASIPSNHNHKVSSCLTQSCLANSSILRRFTMDECNKYCTWTVVIRYQMKSIMF